MEFKKSLIFVVAAEILIAAYALYAYGINLEGLQAVTRFSGRLSLAIFSIIFIFIPYYADKSKSLLSDKPFLIFAIAHGIHLIQLLSYVYLSGNELIPVRLAGGFLAYVLIFSMPVIQHLYIQKKINSSRYTLAENIYLYYVWFIFFMSYLPRVQGKLPDVGGNHEEFVILLVWVCLLMIIKIYLLINNRKIAAGN